jgi:mono/diheme cytochrome c family protein
MRFIAGFCFCLLLLVAGGLAILYSGAYDVGATEPHTPLARWILDAGKRRSIEARADEVAVPAQLAQLDMRQGLAHFREACVICHGAPGIERSEAGLGLQPPAPKLEDVASQWEERELFWIVKNGIRMTGMPAFGPTHNDAEIWAIVALIQKLPGMAPEDYRQLDGTSSGTRP